MTTAAVTTVTERERRRKNAQRGAFLGFFVDMFDIYLPIIALAPAIGYFISPNMSASSAALVSGAIFASTLVGRPLGALIFGHFADKTGRKGATVVAVSGFGIGTVLVGLLPGYQTWGMASVVIFVLLRFLIGIFVGGEYTAASPLAMEYSPKEKRGLNSGLIMSGFPLAYVSVALITLIMLQVAPAGGVDSPYVQWGWRIPFFLGGALALGFVTYYLKNVHESELFEGTGGGSAPVKTLFRGQNLRNFAQVFVLMTGFWLSLNTVAAILPGILAGKDFGLTGTQSSLIFIIAYLVVAVTYVIAAVISQRTGRRPFLIAWGAIAGIAGAATYAFLLASKPTGLVALTVLVTTVAVLIISNWGLTTAYINERFHTDVRATGFGLGYSLAVVIPSFYAFFQEALANVMPAQYTVLPLLMIGGLLISVGAAMGPETRDVDFAAVDERDALAS